MSYCILLVTDDTRLMSSRAVLQNAGHTIEIVTAGHGSINVDRRHRFDLIVIESVPAHALPICKMLRSRLDVPILLLGEKDHVRDRVAALHAGADDYIKAPVAPEELMARMDAALRRYAPKRRELAICRVGGLRINFRKAELVRGGMTVGLSERESRLLRFFLENRGKTLSREVLLEEVWGYRRAPLTRTVDVHIVRLRQKVETDPKHPRFIVTVPGIGYRFNG